MHTTVADPFDEHLSPTERREAIASILAAGLLRLSARPGWCAIPEDDPNSPDVKKTFRIHQQNDLIVAPPHGHM